MSVKGDRRNSRKTKEEISRSFLAKHKRAKSLHELEKSLEAELYASSPNIKRNVPEEEVFEVEEIFEEEFPASAKVSIIDKLLNPPKQIISKYKSDEEFKQRPQLRKHCTFWIVILLLICLLAICVVFARYFYDPNSLYSPLPEIPTPVFPSKLQQWTFRYSQPTNRDLISIAGDSTHGFYIGGSEGTFLYSGSVEDSKGTMESINGDVSCRNSYYNETGSELWNWAQNKFYGTIEDVNIISDSIYLRVRYKDRTTDSYYINSTKLVNPEEKVIYKASDVSFDGNVVYGNGVWLGVDQNQLYQSTDTIHWNLIEISFLDPFPSVKKKLHSIAYGNGRFVLLCTSLSKHYSLITPSDGSLPWQYYEIDPFENNQSGKTIISFSQISNGFVALFNQRIQTSEDGINWQIRYIPTNAPIQDLMCSGAQRCVATSDSKFLIESNSGGLTWQVTSTNGIFLASHCDGEDFCVSVGRRGAIIVSQEFSIWKELGALQRGGLNSFAVYNYNSETSLSAAPWIIEDGTEMIIASNDARYWKGVLGDSISNFDYLAVNDELLWCAGLKNGTIFTTKSIFNGCNWEFKLDSPSSTYLNYLIAIESEFKATGYIIGSDNQRHAITFFSSDYGNRWGSADSNIIISKFVYCSYHNTYVGINIDNTDDNINGLYYSLDCITWVSTYEGQFIGIAADNRTGLYLATDGFNLYKSKDGGWSWKEANCGDCSSCYIEHLGFIPELGCFYQISNSPSQIYLTYDQTSNWKNLEFPYTTSLISLHYAAGSLLAVADNYNTNYEAGSYLTENSRAILSIPVANMTLTEC